MGGSDPRPGAVPPFERAAAVAEVLVEVRRAALGPGRALFAIAPPGAGRSGFLRAARRAACHEAPLATALVDCTALRADQPAWPRLARPLTRRLRLAHAVRRWLARLPGLGRPAAPGEGAAPDAATSALTPSAAALRDLARYGALRRRLLLLDGLERAHPDDLAATAAFARRLGATRTVLVVGVSGSSDRADPPVEELVLELERLGLARRLPLADAVAAALANAHLVPPEHPAAPGPSQTPGASVALTPVERMLLAQAAALGPIFSAAALAHAGGLTELEAEDLLDRLARAGVVRFLHRSGRPGEETSVYGFVEPATAFASLRAPASSAAPTLSPPRSRS